MNLKSIHDMIVNGNAQAAIPHITQLLSSNPRNIDALCLLGFARNLLGQPNQSLQAFLGILALQRNHLIALVNASSLMISMDRADEALPLAKMAADLKPGDPDILRNLALAFSRTGNIERSIATITRALSLRPGDPELLNLKLQFLISAHMREEAHSLASNHLQAFADSTRKMIQAITALSHGSDWEKLEWAEPRFATLCAAPPHDINPTLLMFLLDDPRILLSHANGSLKPRTPFANKGRIRNDGPIRLGFISPDLRDHPVSQMLATILPFIDREAFTLIGLPLLPTDGSAIADRVYGQFHEIIPLHGISNEAAALRIKDREIDVLIDLCGETSQSRQGILATRPAARQVLWLGCPTTTGHTHYDGFIVDHMIAPEGYDAWCSEPLVRLPHSYHPIGCGFPDTPNPITRREVDLPEDAVVIGMLQNPDRVRPDFIRQLIPVLSKNSSAVLWLRGAGHAQDRIRRYFSDRDVSPDRIRFLPRVADRADYLGALRCADLMLDTFPYGGHSTTGEAISLGIPVVARAGNCIHSRVGYSMLCEVGLGDLCAHGPEAHMANLDQLLSDNDTLAEWRHRFASAAQQPAEERHRRLAKSLEEAFRRILGSGPGPTT